MWRDLGKLQFKQPSWESQELLLSNKSFQIRGFSALLPDTVSKIMWLTLITALIHTESCRPLVIGHISLLLNTNLVNCVNWCNLWLVGFARTVLWLVVSVTRGFEYLLTANTDSILAWCSWQLCISNTVKNTDQLTSGQSLKNFLNLFSD